MAQRSAHLQSKKRKRTLDEQQKYPRGSSRTRSNNRGSNNTRSSGRTRAGNETGNASDDDNDLDESFGSEIDSGNSASGSGDEEFAHETAADKRLRIAREYLEQLKEQQDEDAVDYDARDIDRDIIAERLQEDAAAAKGQAYRSIVNRLDFENASRSVLYDGKLHDNLTSACIRFPYCFTAHTDGFIQKWSIDGDKPRKIRFFSRNIKPAALDNDTAADAAAATNGIASVNGIATANKIDRAHSRNGALLCIAIPESGRWVAAGTKKGRILIHDAETLAVQSVFRQHRDAVNGVVFRSGTNELYSCSSDRTIKLWTLDQMGYMQTLFGHQDVVCDIAALASERCVTVGARDRTARFWKVPEESQLVFHQPQAERFAAGSIDTVAQIDETHFVTGSDNGDICLWSIQKKRPLFTARACHGYDMSSSEKNHPTNNLSGKKGVISKGFLDGKDDISTGYPAQKASLSNDNIPALPNDLKDAITVYSVKTDERGENSAGSVRIPRWITSIACCPLSDIVASGSWDGRIRLWRLSKDLASIRPLDTSKTDGSVKKLLRVRGCVNSLDLSVSPDEKELILVAAVGRETRLGRWRQFPTAPNCTVVVKIPLKKIHKT